MNWDPKKMKKWSGIAIGVGVVLLFIGGIRTAVVNTYTKYSQENGSTAGLRFPTRYTLVRQGEIGANEASGEYRVEVLYEDESTLKYKVRVGNGSLFTQETVSIAHFDKKTGNGKWTQNYPHAEGTFQMTRLETGAWEGVTHRVTEDGKTLKLSEFTLVPR